MNKTDYPPYEQEIFILDNMKLLDQIYENIKKSLLSPDIKSIITEHTAAAHNCLLNLLISQYKRIPTTMTRCDTCHLGNIDLQTKG